MKLIGKLVILGALTVGVAGCADSYSGYGYGRGYQADRYGYDRYGRNDGRDYQDRYDRDGSDDRSYDRDNRAYDRDRYDRDDGSANRPDWDAQGAREYCRGPDDRFQPCGVR